MKPRAFLARPILELRNPSFAGAEPPGRLVEAEGPGGPGGAGREGAAVPCVSPGPRDDAGKGDNRGRLVGRDAYSGPWHLFGSRAREARSGP